MCPPRDRDHGKIEPPVARTNCEREASAWYAKIVAHPRIEVATAVLHGKPVIRGTRIPVELLLRKLAEGASEADLLDAYPKLTPEDVHAALAYAADSLAHEIIVVPNAS